MRKKYICTDKFIFSVDHQCHDKVVGSWTDFVSSSRPINGIKNLVSNANAGLMLCYSTLGAFTTFPFGWFTSIKARAVLLIHDTTMEPKDFTNYLQWQNCYCNSIEQKISSVFLFHQIWIVKQSVKYSTVDCKYLLYLQDFFLYIKLKKVQKLPILQYCLLFEKHIWKLIKQI